MHQITFMYVKQVGTYNTNASLSSLDSLGAAIDWGPVSLTAQLQGPRHINRLGLGLGLGLAT